MIRKSSGININFLLLTLIVLSLIYKNGSENTSEENNLTEEVNQTSSQPESTTSVFLDNDDQVCKLPILNINNSEIIKHIKHQPPIKCTNESDWIQINGSTVKITEEAKKKFGDVECKFVSIMRSGDFATFLGNTTTTRNEYVLKESDFFRVNCKAKSGKKWEHRLAGVRMNKTIHEQAGWEHVAEKGMKLNVLIFGIDSMSRLMYMRKLPKTYNKLMSLGGIVLEGHNVLGDGSASNLLPMLTGKTLTEIIKTLNVSKATYVDELPTIWKEFKKFGYVTAYLEDMPRFGTFIYAMTTFKGFNSEPADHYLRTWYTDTIITTKYFVNRTSPYCFGPLPKHQIMLDYAKNLYTVYPNKPKLIFGFLTDLTHDYINLVEAADDDLVEWIEWFEKKGYLNDTLLIMMSDHGQRMVSSVRNTQQGKVEERLPFFSFTFPPWFKDKYPEAYDNLRANSQKLTTPLDINKTLKDLLNFENADEAGSSNETAISLFKKVPKQRSCSDVGIVPHWCTCLNWKTIESNSEIIQKVANDFVNFINGYNSQYTNLCQKLQLDSIHDASELLPNKEILIDYSKKPSVINITSVIYQVKVKTVPGAGLFEFSSVYDKNEKRSTFQIDDISRINKYGNDSLCIYFDQPQLKKYCYCTNQ